MQKASPKNHLGKLKGSQSERGSRKNSRGCAIRVCNTRVDLGGVRKMMEKGNDQAHMLCLTNSV